MFSNIKLNMLFLMLTLLYIQHTSAKIYCSNHTYGASANTSYMQFTKEVIDQEYVMEGNFKYLHCCAKGYRSIEWLKDGKSYPWSSEDTSSLILYPDAENQTIFTRKASKIDEGIYTCVLRNATHRMEHHIDIKVISSSPDIPLATFKPVDQFVNVDGSARFYGEAFIGKKALPNIAISIKWYHLSDDNKIEPININDNHIEEEVVYREDGQIIGSYLTISEVTLNHFGRYLCRIEIGNSYNHRLDMTASLINALPIEANVRSVLTNPIFLGSCAAIIALITFFLLLHFTKSWWLDYVGAGVKKEDDLQKNELAAFSCRNHLQPVMSDVNRNVRTKCGDIKIQIGSS